MGAHEEYGKEILRKATKGAVELSGPSVEIDYGTESPARIDGAYKERIAIELETRTGKQVRGAVLDLICHPHPKKLLVCMPVYSKRYEQATLPTGGPGCNQLDAEPKFQGSSSRSRDWG